MVILAGTSLVISGLHVVGTWMLWNHDTGHDLRRDVKDLKQGFSDVKDMIASANARWSEKHGETTTRMGNIDVTLAELKTEIRMSRGYRREDQG